MSTGILVTIAQGKLEGKIITNYNSENIYSFQGIPYAKAPIGNLRFAPPEPAEPWTGILDATQEGPECPAPHILAPGQVVGDEDNCLNLNIFTKHLPDDKVKPRPVMVWIHGGGFVKGSGKSDLYGPQFLLMEDIVLVTINYRLGPLGFLCLEDTSLGVTGNAGLKDQVMALKWVQNNIKHFNGDPNNVTIFGESAGSASVHCLVLSQLTKGLFHKAIMQSGVALNPWAEGTRGTRVLCKKLGINDYEDKKILEFLRNIPSKKIAEAVLRMEDAFRAGDQRFFGAVIEKPSENALITDRPENIIKSGNWNKVPIMIGSTNKEGYLFELERKLPPYAEYPVTDFCTEIDFHYNVPVDAQKRKELGNRIKKFYFGSETADVDNIEKTVDMKSDNMFTYGIFKAAKLHHSTSQEPIYAYVMTLDTELNLCKKLYMANWFKLHATLNILMTKTNSYMKSLLSFMRNWFSYMKEDFKGAAHGDDLMYLFLTAMHTLPRPNSIEETSIKRFVKLWTNFAKFGNPTPDAKDDLLNCRWKPVDKDLSYLELGEKLEVKTHPFKERMEFWDQLLGELGLISS